MTEPTAKNKLKKLSILDTPVPSNFWDSPAELLNNFTPPSAPVKKKESTNILYCVFYWRNIDGLGETSEFRRYGTEADLEAHIEKTTQAYLQNSDYVEWRITPFMMVLPNEGPAQQVSYASMFLMKHPEHAYYKRNKAPKQYLNGPKANYANSTKHQ